MADGSPGPAGQGRLQQPPGARARADPAQRDPAAALAGAKPATRAEASEAKALSAGWRAMALARPEPENAPPPEPEPLPPAPRERAEQAEEEKAADGIAAAAEKLRGRQQAAPAAVKAADDSVQRRGAPNVVRDPRVGRDPPPSVLTGRPMRPAAREDATRIGLFSDPLAQAGRAPEGGLWAFLDELFAEPLAGEPAPTGERRLIEALLGVRLDTVRLHTSPAVAAAVDESGAQAVTVGDQVAFAPGAYRPGQGDLLAHELAHAAQQGPGRPAVAEPEAADEATSPAAQTGKGPTPKPAQPPVAPGGPAAAAAPGAAPASPQAKAESGKPVGPASEVLQPPQAPPRGAAPPDGTQPKPPPAAEGPSEAPDTAPPAPAPPPPSARERAADADAVAAWKARLASATGQVHTHPPTPGGAAAVQQAGRTVTSSLDVAAAKAKKDAATVITPPKQPQDLPKPPDEATGAAISALEAAAGRTLTPVTLPQLAPQTPRGRAVEIVQGGPGAPVPTPAATPNPPTGTPAAGPSNAAKGVDKLGKALAAPPQPAPAPAAKAPPVQTTVRDEPGAATPLTKGSQQAVGKAVARLMLQAGQRANDLVDGVQHSAFGGGISDWTEITAGMREAEQATFTDELRRVAEAAQISGPQLDAMVKARQAELDKQHAEEGAKRDEAAKTASTEVKKTSADGAAGIDALRQEMDRRTADRVAAAQGKVDPAQVFAERDRLLARVQRLESEQIVAYRTALQRFKDALDAAAQHQTQAYQRAAEADREELRAGKTTREDLIAAEQQFQPVRIWRDDRLRELNRAVERGKVAADAQSETFTDATRSRAREAREAVRDWAAQRLGYERSFFQRLLDWISDWSHQADREAAAFQAERAQENMQATVEGISFLDAEVARLRSMSEAERAAEFANLTAEQQALVSTYFTSGGDRIEAVAAGLAARIAGQRRPEVTKKVNDAVLASSDRPRQQKAAEGANPEFTAIHVRTICYRLNAAFKGPGTRESEVFEALSGLTPLEGKLVEWRYPQEFDGEDLRERLDSELNDWATWSSHDIDRANSLLAGKESEAIAVELDQAMHGTWNGLGIGTDNDTMMRVMRGKSPAEVAAIKRAYKEKYGKDLQAEAKSELDDWFTSGTHDVDRFNALLDSDVDKADAIAVDQGMHGGFFGLGVGTDRKGIEAVYAQIDKDVAAEADRNHWTTARTNEERKRRRMGLSGAYEAKYGGDLAKKPGQSALDAAFEDDASDADLALLRGVSGSDRDLNTQDIDYAAVNASRIALERQSVFYRSGSTVNEAIQEPQQRLTADALRDEMLKMDLERQIDLEALGRGHFVDAWKGFEAAMGDSSGTPAERQARFQKAFDVMQGAVGHYGTANAAQAWGALLPAIFDPNASPGVRDRAMKRFRAGFVTSETGRPIKTEKEFHDDWSPQNQAKRKAQARTNAAKIAAEQTPKEFNAMRNYYNAHYANRPSSTLLQGQDFGGDFDRDVRMMATSITGWDTRTDPATGKVYFEDKTAALLRQNGVLTDTQEVTFAARGLGTDSDTLKRVSEGRSKDEMQALAKAWEAEHPGENFNELLFGTKDPEHATSGGFFQGEFSGREWQDMREAFIFGEPITVDDQLAKARRQQDFEGRSTNRWASKEQQLLNAEVSYLEAEVAKFRAIEAAARAPGHENDAEAWLKYDHALASVEANARAVDAAVAMHRNAVDVVADVAGQIAGAVVIAAAAVAGALITVFSGGTLTAGAVALIAVTASVVGSVLNMGLKYALKGDAYGWEEFGVDLATAVVDAITSYLTAGMGAKLLKGLPFLKNLAGKGAAALWLAEALAEGMENTLGALPSTFVGVLADPSTYEGNVLLNLITGTLGGTAQSLVVAGAMGKVIGGPMGALGKAIGHAHVAAHSRPMVPAAHGHGVVPAGHPHAAAEFHGPTAKERVAAWYEFKTKRPEGTLGEFREHMQRATDTARVEVAQRRAQFVEKIPPERRAEFAKVPIEVVPREEFHARTGKDPDAAHAAVVSGPDGPRVIVQPDAPARALHEEGLHLLQRTEAGHGEKIASFEKMSREAFRALPVEQRAEIVRNYLEVELDAQERLLQSYEAELHSADPDVRTKAEQSIAHFKEKAELYRGQLERLGGYSPEQLRALAEAGHVLLNELPVLQQKKSVGDRPRPEDWNDYRSRKRKKIDPAHTTYEDHPKLKGRDDIEFRQVGETWIEEDLDGTQRRYRHVEVVDAEGYVIAYRGEIESPHGSGEWRQRGSDSAKAGADMELASAELIKRQQREAAERTKETGRYEEVIRLDAKHAGRVDPDAAGGNGNAGFDNIKIEFTRDSRGVLTARIVQVEVKDYAGHVGFDAFTANTRNYKKNVAALAKAIERFKFPSEAHRNAAKRALAARRFALEVHLGPHTSLGSSKERAGSVLGKIERVQRTWVDLERVGKVRNDAEGQQKLKQLEERMLRVLHPDAGSTEAEIDSMLTSTERAMRRLAPDLALGEWAFRKGFEDTVITIPGDLVEKAKRGSIMSQVIGQNFDLHPIKLAEERGFLARGDYGTERSEALNRDIIADRTGKAVVLNQPGIAGGPAFNSRIEADRLIAQARFSDFGHPPNVGGQPVKPPLRPLVDVSNLKMHQIEALARELVRAASGRPDLLARIRFVSPNGQMTSAQWTTLFASVAGRRKALAKHFNFKQTVIVGQ